MTRISCSILFFLQLHLVWILVYTHAYSISTRLKSGTIPTSRVAHKSCGSLNSHQRKIAPFERKDFQGFLTPQEGGPDLEELPAYVSAPTSQTSNKYSLLDASPALVLNADYTPLSQMPLSLWSWQDSLRAVFSGKATVISEYSLSIRSVNVEVKLPSVIALKNYHRMPDTVPMMNRRNVYIRDNFKCCYCMETFTPDNLSLDHVVPRAKGGKLSWTNTVTSCYSCNFRKGQTMPEDLPKLGMKLRSLPRVPSYTELQQKSKQYSRRGHIHTDWCPFLT